MAGSKSNKAGKSHSATKAAKGNIKHDKPAKKTTTSGGGNVEGIKASIYRSMCEQHVMGTVEFVKLDLALDNGYKNPRSEKFAKALKQLTDDGLIQKGGKKETLALSDKGKASIPADIKLEPKDIGELRARYIELIMKKVKMGAEKVGRVFEILLDGKNHTVEGLATKLGYSNHRSFANTKIIATMKDLSVVETVDKKEIRMADKMFEGGSTTV